MLPPPARSSARATHASSNTSSKTIEIVDARPADASELGALFDAYRVFYECASEPERTKRYVEGLLEEGTTRFFIAKRDGAVVGFAHLLQSYDTLGMTDAWILEDLFVDSNARRGGIGSALLRHAESFARRVGATRLSLSTAHTNTQAQRLYEAHGYELNETFRTYNLALR